MSEIALWYPGSKVIDAPTGHVIYKDQLRNLRRRREMLDLADQSASARRHLLHLCESSFEFWANHFVWTRQQREFLEGGKQRAMTGRRSEAPFITWPVHDSLNAAALTAMAEGHPLSIQKSREVMATWDMLVLILWCWRFRHNFTALLVSEIEEKVDGKGSGALFPRLDYMLNRLPWWMRPSYTRTFKHLVNEDTKSSIDGTSTTENVGVGDRYSVIFFDEAGRNPYLREAWDSTADVADCRIPCSTPTGPGAFRDICRDPNVPTFVAGYWHHPWKGQGRELIIDEKGVVTRKAGSRFWDCPWFRRTIKGRSALDIAQNLLIDHDTGGYVVFDSDVLNRVQSSIQGLPRPVWGELVTSHDRTMRELAMAEDVPTALRFDARAEAHSRLALWCGLQNGRPRQDHAYCGFMDPAPGNGAANGVIAIGNIDTGEKVAQFASSTTSPEEQARMAAELSLWFGGRLGTCPMGLEVNGVGEQVVMEWRRVGFRRTWSAPKMDKPGMYTTAQSKRALLEGLRGAYAEGEFLERCERTVAEARTYVYLGQDRVDVEGNADDPQARATHGDRVIATAGLVRMMQDFPRIGPAVHEPHPNGPDWRYQQEQKKLHDAARPFAW